MDQKMATISQLSKHPRTKRKHKVKTVVLTGKPQKKGICIKIRIMKPKKPNSAQRKVARIRLTQSEKRVTAAIPGQGHNLQQYSAVLIRGGRVRDLPGIRCKIIRGVLDAAPVDFSIRKKRRSKFGVKKKVK
jgi:small subunit ribosomal protein S12